MLYVYIHCTWHKLWAHHYNCISKEFSKDIEEGVENSHEGKKKKRKVNEDGEGYEGKKPKHDDESKPQGELP